MLTTVIVIGGLTVGSAYMQRELIKEGKEIEAYRMNMITKGILVVGALLGAGYLISNVFYTFLFPYL